MKYLLICLNLVFLINDATKASTNLCPHITLEDGDLNLNANEKILICGSNKASSNWQEIPIAQAELHLRSILQNHGYLNPQFKRNVDKLQVWSGPLNKVSMLKVDDEQILHTENKRKIIGYPMTPAKLNEVEAWAAFNLRRQGYACSEVNIEAHAWERSVMVQTVLTGKKIYGNIITNDLGGLDQDILFRYQPFELGEIYNIRDLQIMRGRMLSNGLFQSVYFITTCLDNLANIELHTLVGKSKILRFGIGASTEEFPFVDLAFRNARLDNKASLFTTTLHLSPRKESFIAGSEFYIFPAWESIFFAPQFELNHRDENAYEVVNAKLGADVGRSWDQWFIRFILRGGVRFNYVKTLRGTGPKNQKYSSVEISLLTNDHVYEANSQDQFEGWTSSIFYRGRRKGLDSAIAVDRLEINLKHLWNIGEYSPPLFVLGTRAQTVTLDSEELAAGAPQSLLPTEERVYLGGDENLRGFPRASINNNSLGFLTSLYLGLELRLVEQLPYHLQPFLLWDNAKVGRRRYAFESPILTSWGLGIRWTSIAGTLRASIASAQVLNDSENIISTPDAWVFFVSFGREF